MNPAALRTPALACLGALLAVSCAAPRDLEQAAADPETVARYEARQAAVSSWQNWSLLGRLAVSDGKDGGTGRLEWRSDPASSELDFRGTFGRGSWRLSMDDDRAILELASGDMWQARDVGALVREHVGWEVPVDALSWWVRGLAAPGRVESRSLDERGLLNLLSQRGWRIEFQRYGEFSGLSLPTRLEARRDGRQVKLVVRDWTFKAADRNES